MKYLIKPILILLLLCSPVFATTYYVDSNLAGDCAGGAGTSYDTSVRDCSESDGTIAWNDFGNANSTAS